MHSANSVSDLLYTAKYESNRDLYLYLLFEHKSYPEPHIAFHLLRYMIQIWEKDLKNNSSLPLYPIVPLVFYHGKEEWKIATDFKSISADETNIPAPIFRIFSTFSTIPIGMTNMKFQGEWAAQDIHFYDEIHFPARVSLQVERNFSTSAGKRE